MEKLPLDDDIEVGEDGNTAVTPKENRAFYAATGLLIVMIALLVYLLLPADSIFRDDKGMLASFKAPIMQSIVSLLFVFTGAVGLTYGVMVENSNLRRMLPLRWRISPKLWCS